MKRALICLFAGALFACGSNHPPPNDQYAAAEKNVGRAQEVGAVNVPEARLHLQLAQENLATAKRLIDSDNKRAASLISRAGAEAELARSLARNSQAKVEAQAANEELARTKGK